MNKFFLYARKSTDEPDRQILSIESQIDELKEFAQREQLEIVETFIESQTAKEPGRPIFNNMLSSGKFFQLVNLRFNTQNLTIWLVGRFSRI